MYITGIKTNNKITTKCSIWFTMLLILFYCNAQAQNVSKQNNDEYDADILTRIATAEFEKENTTEKGKKTHTNENLRYLNEISFDVGVHTPFNNNYLNSLDGTLYTLQAAHFFSSNKHWGIRTGLSYTDGFSGSNYQITMPLLISYRTNIVPPTYYTEGTSLGEFLTNFIINLIPKRFEFSVGPNIGYIQPDKHTDMYKYVLTRRFALSVDASARMTFKIWRFGIVFTPTASYLATRNFKYYNDITATSKIKSQPSFFFKGTIGLSFRF